MRIHPAGRDEHGAAVPQYGSERGNGNPGVEPGDNETGLPAVAGPGVTIRR